MNVQAIKIIIKTNIPGQADIPFTKSILYHTELSGTDGYNEYPYISDNTVIPNSLVQSLKSGKYSDVADFFFNKKVFIARLEANKAESEAEKPSTVTDISCGSIEDTILQKNTMSMLTLLFPTTIPVNDNIKESYSTNIAPDLFGSGLKLSVDSVKEWFSYFRFSFLNINGKKYTVNRIVWLNDVINHPTYSNLIEEFDEYKAWSDQIKKKLLKEKKDIYERMIQACKNEITSKDTGKEKVPNANAFDTNGIFGDTYKRLTDEYNRYGGTVKSTATAPIYIGDTSNKLNMLRLLKLLKDDIIPDLAKAAWYIKKENEKVAMPDNKTEFNNAIKIQNDYIDFNDTDKPNDIAKIQKYIENMGLDNFKSSYDELNKPSLFSEKFKVFYSNLTKLYERNRIIQSIIGRIDNTAYDKTPIPGEYSKITSMMKSLSDNESTNRESTNKCFQNIIDTYVAVKNTPTTKSPTIKESEKSKLDGLITDISAFKKNTQEKTGLNTFYVGLTRIHNNDALKAPGLEIYVMADVVGGVLDASNIKKARCMYKDKKLTRDFYNIRQKLSDANWQVKPGQFFNVSDIGRPQSNKTAKNPPKQGGYRTRKRKIRRR